MSTAPLRFTGREREAPFDAAIVRKIIADLLTQSADDVESEQIEIKSWCNGHHELGEKVAEAAACLANTSGGYVFVGVADGVKIGRKFSACPYSIVTTHWLQQCVHNLTRPSVECSPYDVSGILADVTGVGGDNLFILRVPRTRCISGHTHRSIAKVRVGKQCQPQFLAEDDRTGAVLTQVSADDLAAGAIDWGMAQHHRSFNTSTSWGDRIEFLAQARLMEQDLADEERTPQVLPSYASVLLFGKATAIDRHVPFFETVVMMQGQNLSIRRNIVDSVCELCLGESSILRSRLPWIPAEVLKELVVNAYIHRCYRTPSPVVIEIAEWGMEIRSPGELLTGLNINNLIHGVPVYRNLLLADGARFCGLCDKIGQGIDLIFKGILTSGLGFPEFESGSNLFVARIQQDGNANFKEFVRKRSQTLSRLDEIIVLRLLWGKQIVSINEISTRMQRKRDFAERVLDDMRKKGMIEAHDGAYQLAWGVRRDIETIFQSDQLNFDESLWG